MKPRFELGLRVDWCLTMKNGSTEPVRNFFVGVNEGRITAARPFKPADRKACRKFIDRKNMVLIPGLINAHTHLPMTLFRGLEDDVPLKVWLFDCILPLEAALTSKAFVKAGTELALRECIRFGTTTVSDMYFFTAASADVWDKGGLRGIFTQAFADFPIPEDKVYGPDREKRFFDLRKKYRAHPRIDIGVAPHAPYSCSDETLRRMGELSRQENCLLHIHVSEAAHEKPDSLEKYGEKPVHRLKRLGVLGERTVGAHSVHLDDDEIELYRETGTSPIYNPEFETRFGCRPAAEISGRENSGGPRHRRQRQRERSVDVRRDGRRIENPEALPRRRHGAARTRCTSYGNHRRRPCAGTG